MEKFMYEDEMEVFLEKEGYDIRTGGEENTIDSTLVSEVAISLGYNVHMNEETDINEFTLEQRG